MKTDNTIIQNNRIIAEFLGWKNQVNEDCSVIYNKKEQTHWYSFPKSLWYETNLYSEGETIEDGNGELMKFHTSYDWLIPVVERIENIMQGRPSIVIQRGRVEVFYHQIEPNEHKWYNSWIVDESTTKIQAVYTAVLQFITWHNAQQS